MDIVTDARSPAASRREFIAASAASGLFAGQAEAGPSSTILRRPRAAGWERRPMRWAQLAFTEDDPGNYHPQLWLDYFRLIGAQGACLSAGGTVAFYPTRIPFHYKSAWLGDRDCFGEMVAGCRALDMAVVARVDPHAVTEAGFAAHPEWVARHPDGSPVRHWADSTRYVACSHGPYNFEFITAVIDEIVAGYDVDAIFGNRWDGSVVCHCATCQTLFRAQSGHDVPTSMDPLDPVRRAYMLWENEHLLGLVDHWAATIRARVPHGFFLPGWASRPQPRIEFDVARLGANPMLTVDRQARSGDSPAWTNGRNAKEHRAFMGDRPLPNIFSVGFEDAHRWKDSVQAPAEIEAWLADGIAQGFRPWLCKFNAKPIDTRWMPAVASIYQRYAARETYLRNTGNLARAAILVSDQNATFFHKVQENGLVDDAQRGFYHALVESRIPFEMVHERLLDPERIDRFDVLILPNIATLSDSQCRQLRDYVARGGGLVATSETSLYDEWGTKRADFGLADLFGCSYAGQVEPRVQNAYIQIRSVHPLTAGLGDVPRVIAGTARVHVTPHDAALQPLTFVPSYPDLPMESAFARTPVTNIPMAFCQTHGKGRVVYFPMDLDRTFWEVMNPDHRRLLGNAAAWAADRSPPMTVEGPGVLDIAYWRQSGSLVAHLVNLTNPMLLKGPFREIVPCGPYRVSLALPQGSRPRRVRLLDAGREMPLRMEQDRLIVEVPTVRLHEMIAIDLV